MSEFEQEKLKPSDVLPQRLSPTVRDLVLMVIGFGCMIGFSRMASLGFVGYLSQGVYESSDAWYGLRSGACIVVLLIIALAGWRRWFKLGTKSLMLFTAMAIAAAILYAVDETGGFGWVVALAAGVSSAVLMYVWMLLLSRYETRVIIGVTLAGLAVSGAIIMGVPHINAALALVVAVLSAFGSGVAAMLIDVDLESCTPDGPLVGAQAARVPWLSVVMVVACGFFATVLYGIAGQLTWLYDWTMNYVAFGVGIVVVLCATLWVIARVRNWAHIVWVPLFALLVVALVFACFSVRASIQVAVGLILAAVFCSHYLHWAIFPALFSSLRIPRAFLGAGILVGANGSMGTVLGDLIGSVLPHSMQNLGGVACLVVIALGVVLVVTYALYRHAFGTVGILSLSEGLFENLDSPEKETTDSGENNPNLLNAGDEIARLKPGASEDQAERLESESALDQAESSKRGRDLGHAESDDHEDEIESPNPLDLLQSRIETITDGYGLTPRESEVAFLTAQGFSCGYIAEKLVVSESTVRFHQKNLYRKLDVHSRNALIEFVNDATVSP